jgi:hypothetical protein
MDNFFLPTSNIKDGCRPLYFSYSLGFLLSRLPTLDCGPNQEDYTYQLARSLNNRIDDGKYVKLSTKLEPCSTKHISLDSLDFRLILAIYIKTECGKVALSLDGGLTYFPVSIFMNDFGYTTCGNQEQIIGGDTSALKNIHLKSLTKDISEVTVIAVGI